MATLGIQEIIERLKQELQTSPDSEALFRISQASIDISFTVEKTAEGDINFHVIQTGADQTTGEVQTVRILLTLNPELSEWQRRAQ